MEEKNIIDIIADAEEAAQSILKKAQEEAATIVTEAEKKSLQISKSAETVSAKRLEEIIAKAEETAERSYQQTVSAWKKDAESYADGILEHVGPQVEEIVGRIVK